jgi:hypothetical protein
MSVLGTARVSCLAMAATMLGAGGPSMALFEKNSSLALRYRAMSVVLWIVLGAIGLALARRASAGGAQLPTGAQDQARPGGSGGAPGEQHHQVQEDQSHALHARQFDQQIG